MPADAKIILVDLDNTGTQFDEYFIERWKAEYPNRHVVQMPERKSFKIEGDYPAEWKPDLRRITGAEGFIANVPPMEGFVQAMHEMAAASYDVRICTSPMSQYHPNIKEKYDWVLKHFDKEWLDRIILAKDKTLIRGNLLIDDNHDVKGAHTPMWTQVIFDRPYSSTAPPEIRRLARWPNWKTDLEGLM